MPKSDTGRQFELVVADISRALDPGAVVHQGQWTDGPDGKRNLDVTIEGEADGTPRRVHIECRDYNPDRGKIGIEQIDALESKHRDMKFDKSFLCSNAGFSDPARRKAKRVGLGLIGVLRERDSRVRYKISDEIYVRRLDFVPNRSGLLFNCGFRWCYPINLQIGEVGPLHKDAPVSHWLTHRVIPFLGANEVVRGHHTLRYRFKYPLLLTCAGGRHTPLVAALISKFAEGGFLTLLRSMRQAGSMIG